MFKLKAATETTRLSARRGSNGRRNQMAKSIFIKADEVAEEPSVSIPYAYKLWKKLNAELSEQGFITIPGRVSRKYYLEKVYGGVQAQEQEDK
jgi:hypothetical protein